MGLDVGSYWRDGGAAASAMQKYSLRHPASAWRGGYWK
jgi:hypothetical protein